MKIIRVVSALSALVAGYAHVKLYSDGYSDIPVGNIGTQFLLNAASAVAIAAALVAPLFIAAPTWLTRGGPLAGIGWGAMSLFAFFMARTDTGWFGFRDIPGLNPSPEAHLSVFPEIIVVVSCAALLVAALRPRPDSV